MLQWSALLTAGRGHTFVSKLPDNQRKREAKVKRRTLTTSCYNTEDMPVAQGEAQLFLELMPERNFPFSEAASEVGVMSPAAP